MRSKFPLLCLFLVGCIEVTPHGGGVSPGPTPGPSPVVPDTNLRRSVAASMADVPRADCVRLYGVFEALASYIDDGAKGIDSTGQLLQLTTKTLDNLSWAKGRYPAVAEAVRVGLNERFKVPKPMADARQEAAATFREIAAGCRDAAVRK